MPQPITVYSFVPRRHSASYYYRIQVPLMTAHDLGLPVRAVIDTDDAGINPEDRIRWFAEADIIHLYQPIGGNTLHNSRQAKSILPSKVNGEWKYPPTLIVDTDDNLFNVNPHNPAFRTLGIRDPDGRDIPVRSQLGISQNGNREIMWHDSECSQQICGGTVENPCHRRIDFARNRQGIQSYRNLIELADAVTCTTPHVAECVKLDTVPQRVAVFPNLVRFQDYEQARIAPEKNTIKILWQGGASHYEDWFPLREALGNITRKYSEVHWIIWGQLYHWVTELIPPHRYTFKPWCAYPEYKLRLAMIGHDINLAPLSPNRFNNCRSAIKWYESSVLRDPAATLAQNTGPYKDEIQHGETGMLFKNAIEFEQQLSCLIENVKLRQTLGSNAKTWVSEHRDAMKHVPKQIAYWEHLRHEVEREVPHMPEDQWDKFVAQQEAEMAEQAKASEEQLQPA